MQFCLGVIPQTATGCHPNHIACFYAYSVTNVYISLSVLFLSQNNHQIWTLETQTFPMICFVKIIKSFDSKRP